MWLEEQWNFLGGRLGGEGRLFLPYARLPAIATQNCLSRPSYFCRKLPLPAITAWQFLPTTTYPMFPKAYPGGGTVCAQTGWRWWWNLCPMPACQGGARPGDCPARWRFFFPALGGAMPYAGQFFLYTLQVIGWCFCNLEEQIAMYNWSGVEHFFPVILPYLLCLYSFCP